LKSRWYPAQSGTCLYLLFIGSFCKIKRVTGKNEGGPETMKLIKRLLLFITIILSGCSHQNEEIVTEKPYLYSEEEPRWISFENIRGEKGRGGMENHGAKGHPSEVIKAGETKTLLDIEGPGMINRIWMTLRPRPAYVLRGLVVNMTWDYANKPAVSVPFGDFFGIGLGRTVPFENALFANPEGRSFVSYIQMPFREAARIEIVNGMDFDISALFYDIDLQLFRSWDDDMLYFHACWHRDTATVLGEDFEIMPLVKGRGRFLGTNVSILSNPVYGDTWWGEGEVKIYLNGDDRFPTLVGTGTEDYIGSGWGQGQFFNRYEGCSIADEEKRQWAFYRYHIPDPVYFQTDCRVTIQQMGGTQKKQVIALLERKVPLNPVTISGEGSKLWHIYQTGKPVDLNAPGLPGPEAWTNFFRSDDVAAVAYFYLDKPVNGLPALQNLDIRTGKLGE
jgi:hypothetical protein